MNSKRHTSFCSYAFPSLFLRPRRLFCRLAQPVHRPILLDQPYRQRLCNTLITLPIQQQQLQQQWHSSRQSLWPPARRFQAMPLLKRLQQQRSL